MTHIASVTKTHVSPGTCTYWHVQYGGQEYRAISYPNSDVLSILNKRGRVVSGSQIKVAILSAIRAKEI